MVLTELEAKRNHPELGWAARQALRTLEELRARARLAHRAAARSTTTAARCGSSSTTRTPPACPATLTADNNDHRILAVARNLADRGPRRHRRHQGPAAAAEGEHRRASTPTSTATSWPPTRSWTGFVELDVEPATIDELFAERVVDLAEARDLPCNTGVALARRARSRRSAGCTTTSGSTSCAATAALFDVRGRSAEQRIAIDLLADPTVGIVSLGGNAGTGKSVLALAAGLDAVLEQRTHKRVVVFRPLYAVGGQDLGFLPGDRGREDGARGRRRCTDALESIAGPEVIDEVLARDLLEVLPLTHIRGRSLTDTLRDHRRGPEPRAAGAAHRAQSASARAAGSCSPTTSPSATTSGSAATTASSR